MAPNVSSGLTSAEKTYWAIIIPARKRKRLTVSQNSKPSASWQSQALETAYNWLARSSLDTSLAPPQKWTLWLHRRQNRRYYAAYANRSMYI